MSNLESAKSAIEAELEQARLGLAHYQSRIEALSNTLAQLDGINGTVAVRPKSSRASLQTKGAKAGALKSARKEKTAKAAKGGNELPFTGGDYWSDLISTEPQSGADILHAAIGKLGFTPTKQQVQKMTNRLTFALHALVKSGKIKDSGAGRERRFFKE